MPPLRPLFSDRNRRQDGWDVVGSLLVQKPSPAHLPEILDPGLLDDFQHPVLTGVVSGQGQMPITEHLVEIAQIAGRGEGRLFRIVSLVESARLLQPVTPASSAHELPDARGPGDGLGIRVVGALDHADVNQIFRHAFLPEDFSHHLLVPAEPVESDPKAVPTLAPKILDKLLDLPVAGDCYLTFGGEWERRAFGQRRNIAREFQEILAHARFVKYFLLD